MALSPGRDELPLLRRPLADTLRGRGGETLTYQHCMSAVEQAASQPESQGEITPAPGRPKGNHGSVRPVLVFKRGSDARREGAR